MSSLTTDDVGAVLQEIFDDLGEDLDLGDVTLTAETRLLDLGLESISLVYSYRNCSSTTGWATGCFAACARPAR